MKFIVTLFTILLMGLVIFSVKNTQSKIVTEQISSPTYVKAIYSMPISYDPIRMNDGASLTFSELVYEGLLRFTEDYGVIPMGGWSDLKTFQIYLRMSGVDVKGVAEALDVLPSETDTKNVIPLFL